jgi:hypothetical protein
VGRRNRRAVERGPISGRRTSHCFFASPRRRQQNYHPGQVFGLCRLNPTCRTSQIASRSVAIGCDPVSSSAFVPAYRCGAVPESHRIPFSPLHSRTGDRGIDPLYPGLCVGAIQDIVDIGGREYIPRFTVAGERRRSLFMLRLHGHDAAWLSPTGRNYLALRTRTCFNSWRTRIFLPLASHSIQVSRRSVHTSLGREETGCNTAILLGSSERGSSQSPSV